MEQELVVGDKDIPREVREAVAEGRKIVAIKLLRESTGLGLANAKVIVDRLASRQARNNPAEAAIGRESPARRMLRLMALLLALFVAWQHFFAG